MILENNKHIFDKKEQNVKKLGKNNNTIIKKQKAEYIPTKLRHNKIEYKDQSDTDNLGKSYDKIIFIKKKTAYIKNKQKNFSPKKGQSNDLNYTNNTLDNKTFTNNIINGYSISPIKIVKLKNKIIDNNKNDEIISNNNNNFTENNDYSKEYYNLKNKYLSDNKYLFYNIKNSKKNMAQKKDLNMFQKKMITISVQIINRNILKHKKNSILNQFFMNFKKISSLNNKHSATKSNKDNNDNIYDSVKTNNFLIENIVNGAKNNINKEDKEEDEISIKKNTVLRTKKDEIKRLKELEKKYEKFYEKKKNSNVSLNDKYRNYCLHKNITNYFNYYPKFRNATSNKSDESKNDDAPKEAIISLFGSEPKPKNKLVITKKLAINNLANSLKNFENYNVSKTEGNSINEYNDRTPMIYNNKIIIKKLKITPKIRKSISKDKLKFKKKDLDLIITNDKRLYIHINYKNLYDHIVYKKNKNNYDNNFLSVANKININIINPENNYFVKHPKFLNKIQENEINIKYNNAKSESKKIYNKGKIKRDKKG
jgi:hypothetical protein